MAKHLEIEVLAEKTLSRFQNSYLHGAISEAMAFFWEGVHLHWDGIAA
jgi:hypothetical protein